MSTNSLPADNNGFPESSAPSVSPELSPPSSPEVSPSDCEIFISYREDADSDLASALKKQLESSLEPKPRVFTAGFRGLRPSDEFWNVQLQRAARSAKAIVGIITQKSKDREWILFEAGAAWGRGILYTPFLVDTDSSNVPSALSSYQAIKADNPEQIQLLFESLAKALGSRVKKSLRLYQLKSAVQAYRGPGALKREDEEQEALSGDLLMDLWRAFTLELDGKSEEAAPLFQGLAEKASNPEDKVLIRAVRILSRSKDQKDVDFLLKFEEELEESLRNTADYHYWRGLHEVGPYKRLAHLRRCLAMRIRSGHRRDAYLKVAELQYALGQSLAAERSLLQELVGRDRYLSQSCAIALERQLPEGRLIAKLAALVAGVNAYPSDALFNRLCDLTLDSGLATISMVFARMYDAVFKNGRSSNSLGRALDNLNLPSLAYEAYSRAMELGASVGRANAAQLVGRAAVPFVGLKMLEAHTGTIESASPNFPHTVRANLETQVHQERERLEELEDCGRRVVQTFMLIVEQGLASDVSKLVHGGKFRWRAGAPDATWQNAIYCSGVDSSGKVTLSAEGVPSIDLYPVFPGYGLFSFTLNQAQGLMALTPEGGFEGSRLDLKAPEGRPMEWLELASLSE